MRAGNLIAAVFPSTQSETQQTIAGAVAQVNGFLHVLSLVIGAILVSRRFSRDERLRSLHPNALILSLVMLAEFIVVAATIATESEIAGLVQRVFILTALGWFTVLATRLRAIAIEPANNGGEW